MQDLVLGLLEPREVHTSPLLELVQVSLDSLLSLRHINCTTQVGVVCKLAEGALDPSGALSPTVFIVVYVIDYLEEAYISS